eukprot:TRINITY_DN4602_c0_g1_i2.p1 TRINITY_DN4602_c0_g1~~TRINITY_DN4602_c0_g1_i2.p1  ORF type:complete len:456 (+),score=111.65 TRINITY_DN4602_c0_g1_i2:641-2008(+)
MEETDSPPATSRDSRNVWICLAYSFGFSFSLGVWGMAILGPYLYALTHSNTAVGWAEGIQGACLALAAIPAGIYADKNPANRVAVLKLSALFGVVTVLATLGAIHLNSFNMVTGALAMWGIFQGLWSPGLSALLADSVDQGQRSKIFTTQFALTVSSTSAGPVLSLILFHVRGDSWTLSSLSLIFALGVLVVVPFNFLLCGLQSPGSSEEGKIGAKSEVVLRQGNTVKFMSFEIHQGWIPGIVAFSNFIAGLASGMTIKFFPLFFENQCKLSPTFVSSIFVISPLMISIFAWFAQKLSLKIGRIQVSTICVCSGVSLLVVMSFHSLWDKPEWIVSIYLIRTALINARAPLVKSVLMDYTSPAMRAKWSSLESVTSFGWSGSAVLGGILADQTGYGRTFLITAAMQFVSCLVLMLITPIVRLESQKLVSDTEEDKIGLLDEDNTTLDPEGGENEVH